MLRTRLWMGTLLIGLAVLILLEDRWFAPWYPVLFVCYVATSLLAARELVSLHLVAMRPSGWLTLGFVALMAAANWWSAIQRTPDAPAGLTAWSLVGACLVVGTIAAFVWEMWRFRGSNGGAFRVALTVFTLVYLGVLPSFFAQLRWPPGPHSTIALALTVFVPKGNDIGAYFSGRFLTGRVLGRHQMAPKLSPKKTWQGAIGGMVASVIVAVAIDAIWPILPGWIAAVGFGLTVGLAGVLGDLAESLLKRDLQTKDASQSVPGFGGVLDVIDSLLFAAPVAYLWFRFTT
jgi:phosphatidate cytidylyltransferase